MYARPSHCLVMRSPSKRFQKGIDPEYGAVGTSRQPIPAVSLVPATSTRRRNPRSVMAAATGCGHGAPEVTPSTPAGQSSPGSGRELPKCRHRHDQVSWRYQLPYRLWSMCARVEHGSAKKALKGRSTVNRKP